MANIKLINHSEFKALREKQWLAQDCICPILKIKIDYENAVFDHLHKTKAEKLGEDGKGLLRGVMHFQANSWEGKVTNAFKRYGLHKFGISLPDALRNLADYIENPPIKERIVHPNERPKIKKLGKRDYNKITKYYFEIYPNRKKLPAYPKSGKMTKQFKELLERTNKWTGPWK